MSESMTLNGNNPSVTITTAQPNRMRASGPILLLAILFVVASFLTWYFTWFGRELSDSEISKYLLDEKHPRHVQHALLQIQQRIEQRNQTARKWYPQILVLVSNPETEFRLTVAWMMGFDNGSEEFHQALSRLVRDPEPIVRRNAALALVRFNDATGREELVSILQPYSIRTTTEGMLVSALRGDSQISRGALLARIQRGDANVIEIRSPLPGTVETIATQNGAKVRAGDLILTIRSDEGSVWEALRGLQLIGEKEDLPAVRRYMQDRSALPERIRQQAALTTQAIESRVTAKG